MLTCSLRQGVEPLPISITGPEFKNDGNDRNIILWLDHRAISGTEKINSIENDVLRDVGGKMSIEIEIPRIL